MKRLLEMVCPTPGNWVLLKGALILNLLGLTWAGFALGAEGRQAFEQGQENYRSGRYIEAARYAFSAMTSGESKEDPGLSEASNALVAESLLLAGFPQSSLYFSLKALSSSRPEIRRQMTSHFDQIVLAVGTDVMKAQLSQFASEADFQGKSLSFYRYFMAKSHLLAGRHQDAINSLQKIGSFGHLGVLEGAAYFVQAVAKAHLNDNKGALSSFSKCLGADAGSAYSKYDLENRCLAGKARVYYQMGDYKSADETYDLIPKASLVWPDILFEQAWNSFALQDFNRALGKLVSYKSPFLSFVFNPEIEVLRAQIFASLCRYDDVNGSIQAFHSSSSQVGLKLKELVQKETGQREDSGKYIRLFERGRSVFGAKISSLSGLDRVLAKFVKTSHFEDFLNMDSDTQQEYRRLKPLLQGSAFLAFLEKVLSWRRGSIQILGGVFVYNAFLDAYNEVLENLDKISFIKTELLSQMKQKADPVSSLAGDRLGQYRGELESPERKDDQYFWSFNGEFWNDELGDYVFALRTSCREM